MIATLRCRKPTEFSSASIVLEGMPPIIILQAILDLKKRKSEQVHKASANAGAGYH